MLYNETTAFPGLAALPPCLGAALIIAAGESGPSLAGRLLSLRPVVFVGLISYSLYLWHWPLLVFQTTSNLLVNQPTLTHKVKLAVFVASLALGTLSWRFVERPFREGRWRPSARALFAITGVSVIAITAVAASILALRGLPGRFQPDALQAAQYLNYTMGAPFRGGTCFLGPDEQFVDFNPAACLAPDPARKAVLLLGDSHAAALGPGLRAAYPELNLAEVTASYCPFLSPDGFARPGCRQMLDFLYRDYLIHGRVGTILLSKRWEQEDVEPLTRFLAFAREHGMEVILLGTMPEYDLSFPRLLAHAIEKNTPALVEQHRDLSTLKTDQQFAALARDRWHVPYVSIQAALCTPTCPSYASPGVPLEFDTHHLTEAGSILAMRKVRAANELQPWKKLLF